MSDIGDALVEVEGLAGALEGEMGNAKDTLRTLEDDNAHQRHLYLALLQRQVRKGWDERSADFGEGVTLAGRNSRVPSGVPRFS